MSYTLQWFHMNQIAVLSSGDWGWYVCMFVRSFTADIIVYGIQIKHQKGNWIVREVAMKMFRRIMTYLNDVATKGRPGVTGSRGTYINSYPVCGGGFLPLCARGGRNGPETDFVRFVADLLGACPSRPTTWPDQGAGGGWWGQTTPNPGRCIGRAVAQS